MAAAAPAAASAAVSPRPFKIAVGDDQITDLKARLAAARFPDALEGLEPWEDGTDPEYFKEFVAYWRDGYDWRAWEAKLNAFSQFTLPVEGVELHFIHERSPAPPPGGATPLLLLHGWPGSVLEFYKLIPMLKETGQFDIVAPSLPGYGFSSAPKRRGFGACAIARAVDALMAALGYDRYIAQGGDWGAIVCRALAKNHAPRCAAVHLNMCVARPSLTNPWHIAQIANLLLLPGVPLLMSANEIKGVQDMRRFEKYETAYQRIQGTKPQTLAYALTDSPVGLGAWILEKFRTWSDNDGSPEGAFTKDEMLTNICIYWFGGRIASSIRLYKETLANRAEMACLLSGYAPTPAGVAIFPKELYRPPRSWAAALYNVEQWAEMPAGGHFAALERPELLFGEVVRFAAAAREKGWLRPR